MRLLLTVVIWGVCLTPAFAAVIGPPNGGFEEPDGVRPRFWGYVNLPVHSLDPADAFTGDGSVKCSAEFFFQHLMAARAERIYAAAFQARGETAREQASVQLRFLNSIFPIGSAGPSFAVSPSYSLKAFSTLSPAGSNGMMVVINAARGWVWYDDLVVLDDTIANATLADLDGDTAPDRWGIAGSVVSVTGAGPGGWTPAARLSPGSAIAQSFALLPDTHPSISVCLRGDPDGVEARLGVNWRDRDGAVIAAFDKALSLTSAYAVHTIAGPVPPEGVFGEVLLENDSATGDLYATGFTAAWAAARPNPFSPNDDGVREESEIVAAFSNIDEVVWTVRDASGDPVTVPVLLSATGTLHLTWDGRDSGGAALPSGTYTGCFEFLQSNGETAAATLPLEIDSPHQYPVLPNAAFPEFITFAHGAGGRAFYRDLDNLRLIRQQGMTDVWMLSFNTPEEVVEILDLAHEADLMVSFLPHDIISQIFDQRRFQTPDEIAFGNALRDRYQNVLDHPALRGFICTNEPSDLVAADAQLLKRILQSIAPDKPIIANLSPFRPPLPLAQAIAPSVVLVNRYALRQDSPAGMPANHVTELRKFRDAADAVGADFWHKGQAYTDDRSILMRTPWPSEMRLIAYTPLALGARGFGYFTFAPYQEGFYAMIDIDGEPSRPLRDMALTNHRLQRIKGDLHTLDWVADTNATVSSGAVSEFADPLGRTVLLVVNREVAHARSLTVSWPGSAPGVIRDLLTGNTLTHRSAAGQTVFDLVLAPGDARYVRLEP